MPSRYSSRGGFDARARAVRELRRQLRVIATGLHEAGVGQGLDRPDGRRAAARRGECSANRRHPNSAPLVARWLVGTDGGAVRTITRSCDGRVAGQRGEPPRVDRDCELKAPDESRAVVRYTRHTLDPADLKRHLDNGLLPTKLALTWNDRVSLVLTESLALKRIALLDVVLESPALELPMASTPMWRWSPEKCGACCRTCSLPGWRSGRRGPPRNDRRLGPVQGQCGHPLVDQGQRGLWPGAPTPPKRARNCGSCMNCADRRTRRASMRARSRHRRAIYRTEKLPRGACRTSVRPGWRPRR